MKCKIFFICAILIMVAERVPGQLRLDYLGEWVDVEKYEFFTPAKPYNAHVRKHDHPYVIAFKSYFAPSSFNTFQDLFLPADWNGMTKEEFQEWQSLLTQNPLYLEMAAEVQDKHHQKYLLLFYTMELSHFRFYQSKTMKWVDGKWKHRNLDDTSLTNLLELIGSIEPSYLKQVVQKGESSIPLNQIPPGVFRTFDEKFTIESLIPTIRECLLSLEIAQEDIDHALTLLQFKDKEGMISYLGQHYKIEDAALMQQINTALGFTFYNFFHTAYPSSK